MADYITLNKTGIYASTLISIKEWSEKKALTYSRMLTNKCRRNNGIIRKSLFGDHHSNNWGFPGGSAVNNLPAKQETRLGRSSGEGNCYSWRRQWHPTPVLFPGNPMDRGAWWAAVHGVATSRKRLNDFTFTFHFHALEKEMATHSSVLAWRIPGMGEPGGLPSMGLHRVGHDWSDLAAAAAARILAWEIPWTEEPGRLRSMGLQNSWTQHSD